MNLQKCSKKRRELTMNKKMKKALIAVPLSVSLLIPTFSVADAHGHESHSKGQMSAEVTNPAIDLLASLDTLLSEHAFLAVVIKHTPFIRVFYCWLVKIMNERMIKEIPINPALTIISPRLKWK
jgi:hypothetical protein